MILRRVRGSLSTALLGAGLLIGGTAVAQMSPQQPAQPGQSQNGQWNAPPATDQTQVDQSANAGQATVLVDPGKIYNSSSPTAWVGKPVVLQNVMIQDTNDTGNFWVGSDSHHRILIVKSDNDPNLAAMRFHKGDVVTVYGTVQPASKYMSQETTASSGSMHDAEKSSGVFLLANKVSITSSTQH